ncbi:sulfotransferase family protein [Haloferula chungangensis]
MALKIIGAGNGRTGTKSLKLALEHLGYGPTYHMYELFERPEDHKFWQEAIETGSTDWDDALADYQSIVDYPGCAFFKSLYQHFPGSKVILTLRDGDSWYESSRRTIYSASPGFLQRLIITAKLPFNARLRKLLPVFRVIDHGWDDVFEGKFEDRDYAIARYNELNQKVIDAIPPEDLLVLNLGDGWEPLCAFLGVPVPDIPYPRANQRSSFKVNMKDIRHGRIPSFE